MSTITNRVRALIEAGEGQTVEFKTSLAERTAGIQTLVAFANSLGGTVLLGVENDGAIKGVTVGDNTIEELANYIKQHTYPTLPVSIDHCPLDDGKDKQVIAVEVAKDTPLVAGVYLYSSDHLDSSRPVDARRLQAYRRVGRVTQREDFMRLRAERPTDPLVVFGLEEGTAPAQSHGTVHRGVIWLEEGSQPIYDVALSLDPRDMGSCDLRLQHMPNMHSFVYEMTRASDFFVRISDNPQNKPVWLVATYSDAAGLRWEARRELEVFKEGGWERRTSVQARARFIPRIIQFPPKMQ